MDGRGVADSCILRTGESGRGSDVRGFLPVGLEARAGPTDWENLDMDGVGGV
jgi:hypothetical protein